MASDTDPLHGSYASWKVLEFEDFKFQAWKNGKNVLDFCWSNTQLCPVNSCGVALLVVARVTRSNSRPLCPIKRDSPHTRPLGVSGYMVTWPRPLWGLEDATWGVATPINNLDLPTSRCWRQQGFSVVI